jgi:hypothetical protein
LNVDVPVDFVKEIMAPSDMVLPGLKKRDLRDALREVFGEDADVQFRLQFR